MFEIKEMKKDEVEVVVPPHIVKSNFFVIKMRRRKKELFLHKKYWNMSVGW